MRVLAIAAPLSLFACGSESASVDARLVTGGDASRGVALIRQHGCGTCHTIDGVPGAHGRVGPSLEDFAERPYIAGSLTNTPDEVVRWIMDPQVIAPNTVMPDLGLREADARDVAAHLYAQ